METLKQVLMRRDGMDEDEAEEAVREAWRMVAQGADPEQVLEEEFGLEPDWFFELV
jgi:hypothetical protein